MRATSDTIWNTKTSGTQNSSTEGNGAEILDFVEFQAQKKTSMDVFSCSVGGAGVS